MVNVVVSSYLIAWWTESLEQMGQKQVVLARKATEALTCTVASQFLYLSSLRW